jgi:VanZ family protein
MKKLSIILCVIFMGFIFYMSSKTGTESNEKSFAVVNAVKQEYKAIQNSEKNASNKSSLPVTQKEKKINLFLRKNAHALEYLILALLVCNAFFSNKHKGKGIIIYILFICLFYAVTDEFHQLFVAGRTARISDVLIDFSGSLVGMGIYYFVYYVCYNKYRAKCLKSS